MPNTCFKSTKINRIVILVDAYNSLGIYGTPATIDYQEKYYDKANYKYDTDSSTNFEDKRNRRSTTREGARECNKNGT